MVAWLWLEFEGNSIFSMILWSVVLGDVTKNSGPKDNRSGANASEVIMELMRVAPGDKALLYLWGMGRGYRDTGDKAEPLSLNLCRPIGRYQEDLIY